MGKFLHAAYALRISQKYKEIRDQIPVNQFFKHSDNVKRLIAWVPPYIAYAYREGIDYAAVEVQARFKKVIKRSYEITAKMKNQLFVEFIDRLNEADAIYRARVTENEERKWNEYVNGFRSAVNNLLIRAGAEGCMMSYRRARL